MNPAGPDRISELNEDMVEKIGKMGACRYRSRPILAARHSDAHSAFRGRPLAAAITRFDASLPMSVIGLPG